MAFAENLKKFRTEKGFTQAELANLIEIAQPTLAQYEKGLKYPTIITAVSLAQSLGTTCEWTERSVSRKRKAEIRTQLPKSF